MRQVSNNDIRISSWLELMNIFAQDTSANKLGRHRSDLVYRGLADSRWELKTSLQRSNKEYWEVEKHLYRNFVKYAPQSSVVFNTFWNWLTLAQHHGLPTRLLDWTYSPMLAVHFALNDHSRFEEDGDAVIWSVDLEKLKSTLPKRELAVFKTDGGYSFSIESLAKLWKSLEKLSSDSKKDFLIFFEPPSFDDRIINQYALLSTTRNSRTVVSEWLKKNPSLYRRIIIPKKLKWEFRDRLDQMNITERMTHPGLDGLCLWLKRWYCSK